MDRILAPLRQKGQHNRYCIRSWSQKKKIDRLIAPGLDILVHLHKTLMVPARLGTAPGPDGRSDVELCYAKIIVPGMILENVLRINYIIRGRGRRHWAIFGGPTVQGHCVSEECHRAPISEEDDDKFVLCWGIDDSDVWNLDSAKHSTKLNIIHKVKFKDSIIRKFQFE